MESILQLARTGEISVLSDVTVLSAMALVQRSSLPGLVVMENDSIMGTVSSLELAMADPKKLISSVSIRKVSLIKESSGLIPAWKIMRKEKAGIHPVVDDAGNLKGLISYNDLIEHLLEHNDVEVELKIGDKGKWTVLIVDDSRLVRESLKKTLEKEGYQTLTASNGKEALKMLEKDVDLVMLDVDMPPDNGYDILRTIRSESSMANIPVIMLTAMGDIENRIEAFAAGADDYLLKPYNRNELLVRTQNLLKSRALSGELKKVTEENLNYFEQLKELREFNEDVIEHMISGLIVMDLKSNIIKINQAALDILHIENEVDVLENPISCIDPVFKAFSEVGKNGKEKVVEFCISDELTKFIGYSSSYLLGPNNEKQGIITIFDDLTEQKQAEEALNKSEEKYRTLFEQAKDGIYIIDPATTRFMAHNENACQQTGYSSDELLKLTIDDITAPEFVINNRAIVGELMEAGSMVFELELKHKNGHEFPVEISAHVIEYGGEKVFQCFARDVSLNKKATEEVQQGYQIQTVLNNLLTLSLGEISLDEMLDEVINQISFPWLDMEMKGAIFLVGDETDTLVMKAHRALNDELLSLCAKVPFGKCICGKAAETLKIEFSDCVDERHDICYDGMAPHGHYSVPIISGCELLGILTLYLKEGHKRDIKEEEFLYSVARVLAVMIVRMRMQETLKESEENYRSIFETAPNFIVSVDKNGIILDCNNRSRQFIGFSREELVNSSMREIVHPDYHDEAEKALNEVLTCGSFYDKELKMIRENGDIIDVNCNSAALKNEDGGYDRMICVIENTTERKQAAEALMESEQRFRSVFERAPMGMIIAASKGDLQQVNPAFCKFVGYSEDEILKLGIEAITHEEDRGVSFKLLDAGREGKLASYEVEKRYICKDGSVVWGYVSASRLYGLDGNPSFNLALIQDITEHKKADEALLNAASEWRETFDSINDMVMIVNSEHIITRVNKATAKALGLDYKDILGGKCYEMFHGTDKPPDYCPHVCTLEDGQAHIAEIFEPKFDKYFMISTAPILDVNDVVNASVHIMRDISERKNAEQERIRLMTAIDQAAETVVVTDNKATIQYVNPAFEKVTGYTKEEAIGKNPRVLQSGEHNEEFYDELWATLLNGNTWEGHFINKRKDGTLFEEEAAISPVKDESGEIVNFVAVKKDVTREVAMQKKLRHSEKLATIGELAGSIAHEVKNPIFAISSGVQILQEDLNIDDDERETLDIIYKETMRVDRLIKQLLSFGTAQKLEIEPVKIDQLIGEVVSLNQGLIRGKGIDVKIIIPDDMPNINADRDKMVQVLINLLQNAIDASYEGGEITIKSRVDSSRQFAVVEVNDNGQGIPEEHIDNIFSLFFTTKKGSSGMGLSISRKIIRDHSGDVRIMARKGGGTSVIIEIPLG